MDPFKAFTGLLREEEIDLWQIMNQLFPEVYDGLLLMDDEFSIIHPDLYEFKDIYDGCMWGEKVHESPKVLDYTSDGYKEMFCFECGWHYLELDNQ